MLKSHFIFSFLLLAFIFAKVIGESIVPFADEHFAIKVNDPELTGPDKLCNIYGSVIGVFSGGGDSATDIYKWTILAPDGSELFTRPAGSFPTIDYTFELLGVHKVLLEVSRGGKSIASLEQEVAIIAGPELTLADSYKICEGNPLELQAISPSSTNFSNYIFEWTNESGDILGTQNTLTVDTPGKYKVQFYTPDVNLNPICDTELNTEVEVLSSLSITQTSDIVCKGSAIEFEANTSSRGLWLLTAPGETEPKVVGTFPELALYPEDDFTGHGEYQLEYVIENPSNPSCSPSATTDFTYQEEPLISLESATAASACFVSDGGLELLAVTDLDQVTVGGLGISFGPYLAGETISIPGLESGAYTIYLSWNGCQNSIGTVVPLITEPAELEFTVSDIISETCTPNGKINGFAEINMSNGPTTGSYRVLTQKGQELLRNDIPAENPFKIELAGGKYYFELLNEDSCNLPRREILEIPGKAQTKFSIPQELTICGTYELLPETDENLQFTLTDPLGNSSTQATGELFSITEAGEYTLVGILPDQDDICPSEQKITISTTDPIPFDPVLKSEDCVIGNRVYTADIQGIDPGLADFYWRNQNGDIIGTGQELFLAPTSVGTFSLEVQPTGSEACPITPKEFIVEPPVLFVDVSIESTKLCEFGPEAIVELSTTSPEAVTDIRWRRFDEEGVIVELPEFDDQTSITTRIGGTYEASVYSIKPEINKNCELGRTTFQLDLTPDKVSFDIPDQLTICDYYELTPSTTQNLNFEISTPSGEILTRSSGEVVTIDQAGVYTFLAFDQNSPTPFCPEQKELLVNIFPEVLFEPELFQEECDGTKTFQAKVENYVLEEVEISWKNASGDEIGTDEFLTISAPGDYSLEVQPSGAIPCHISAKPFTVLPPVLEIEVNLIAEPLCPDAPSALMKVATDFDEVERIEWWFTAIDGSESQLVNETNNREILAINEGTYEVRVFNQIPCLLGYDNALVLRSTDTVRPELNDSYQVCPKYEIGPLLDPGNFASYEWYFGEQLVSTSPTFKPLQVGNYQLIVYSSEGCVYEKTFTTTEECELRVSYPNAIQPRTPDKGFLIYTNYLVDELEVIILNKWGQTIFQCAETDLISEEFTCVWDGTYNGSPIQNDTYAVRVNFKNYEKNISKSEFGSVIVIQ
ncbi:hypothetical protein [Algoriphagus halophytocola]|uniref:Ig-like domain-containing protein n=1 Tax=Algoriphagus halophytocola TaxID=2991499 RepID=A0ABY6MP24_9BACT|nr:hypothetical protein [Algoriphagus sp. TR-M5]UZD24451.1 hypothetical protein OM944_08095 [Algoriphagus sp. TR-M5]